MWSVFKQILYFWYILTLFLLDLLLGVHWCWRLDCSIGICSYFSVYFILSSSQSIRYFWNFTVLLVGFEVFVGKTSRGGAGLELRLKFWCWKSRRDTIMKLINSNRSYWAFPWCNLLASCSLLEVLILVLSFWYFLDWCTSLRFQALSILKMEIFLAARSSPDGLQSSRLLQPLSAFIDILIYEIVNGFKELIRLFRFVGISLPCS